MQVKKYTIPWPEEWGPKDHSKICVTSPSRTQVIKVLYHVQYVC